jgi:hypothetical protein
MGYRLNARHSRGEPPRPRPIGIAVASGDSLNKMVSDQAGDRHRHNPRAGGRNSLEQVERIDAPIWPVPIKPTSILDPSTAEAPNARMAERKPALTDVNFFQTKGTPQALPTGLSGTAKVAAYADSTIAAIAPGAVQVRDEIVAWALPA